jgi:DNA-binding NarL/FixJ family response regulator
MMAIRERPDLKVVLMSGYSDSNIMDQIASRNDLVFLPKPIPDDHLLHKLREVLDGGGT